MSNKALNHRIATEFMGWELSLDKSTWCEEGECIRGVEDFNPTTDMHAAYLVLEKIRTKLTVEVTAGRLLYSIYGNYDCKLSVDDYSLPLAISKLAEAIMDSPEHMGLFK